jgi:hypothetical protein
MPTVPHQNPQIPNPAGASKPSVIIRANPWTKNLRSKPILDNPQIFKFSNFQIFKSLNPMKSYKNDPRKISVRYFCRCAICMTPLNKGAQAFYYPATKAMYCLPCGEKDYNDFISSAIDEEFYQSQYR